MVTSPLENGSRVQANGVLPVTATQTLQSSGGPSRLLASKVANTKLKVIIRRLAPGLTEAEFTAMLGDDWKLGRGKVDWFSYKPGKDSKDPSKPSRPSRAYLHLLNEDHLLALSGVVRQGVFEDAQLTFTNQCLIGPPTLEFAPYGRSPGGRQRIDARAGTIDQDPEFMAFLEGLANPTTDRDVSAEPLADITSGKQEKVTTTPLVQFLKDKKATKSKEAAVKSLKKQDAQAKSKSSKESPPQLDDGKKRGKDAKVERSVEKAAKEAVRILNREASAKSGSNQPSPSSTITSSQSSSPPKLDVSKVPGRQRSAVVAAHIRMLQRDLGLTPAQAHRQVRRDTADAQKAERVSVSEKTTQETKQSPPTALQSQATQSTPKLPPSQSRKSRGKTPSSEIDTTKGSTSDAAIPASAPVVLLRKPSSQQPVQPGQPSQQIIKSSSAAATAAATPRKPQLTAVPAEGATQAFVKHANPSQGVTEALLKEAMENFGPVSSVEIDKRKGFAYVDFVGADGLRKAMAANPIVVAQGTVQVMQRKGTALPPEKKAAPQQAPHGPSRGGSRGGRGTIGRRGGRGARGGPGLNSSSDRAPSFAPTGPAPK